MGNFQYKSGSTWYDVPDYAHPDNEGGSIALVRPEPTAKDGLGAPCGAVGQANVVIRASRLRGDGWAWWQTFFANANELSTTLAGITAYDERSGTWKQCTDGRLLRPKGTCRPGASLVRTLYSDIEIVIENVTVT